MGVSSPRTWGCTGESCCREVHPHVVPTHVGVYRSRPPPLHLAHGRPHARGGVPGFDPTSIIRPVSSPRTWGCTGQAPEGPCGSLVVPTHVGVYRRPAHVSTSCSGRPHARGGVPEKVVAAPSYPRSSPRTWGCTGGCGRVSRWTAVVPTHVGVYRWTAPRRRQRRSRPHARGGVPTTAAGASSARRSSPRT